MNWVTTNIRLPEEDYLALKMEALLARKSVASIVRERIAKTKKDTGRNNTEKILMEFAKIGRANALVMKGESLSDLLIQMRYEQ